MRNYLRRIPMLLFLMFCSFSCVHQTVKIHQGESLPAEQYSVLVTDSKDVTIERINRKKITTFQQLWNSKWNAEVSLTPGEYTIEVEYRNYPSFKEHFKSRYLFKLGTLSGHTYKIEHKVIDKSAKLWIIDLETSENAGKVLASENEPITEIDTTIDHSIYFRFIPPKNDKWIIAYRNNYQTALAKRGNHPDETYGLSISIFELPNFEKKAEFIEFLKAGRGKDIDPKRFSMIKDEINYYEDFVDYCARYHSIAEDKKAKKRSKNKEPMIIEMTGYTCRHPINKNLAVNFDYSHRYYKGHEDKDLAKMATALFKQLAL